MLYSRADLTTALFPLLPLPAWPSCSFPQPHHTLPTLHTSSSAEHIFFPLFFSLFHCPQSQDDPEGLEAG